MMNDRPTEDNQVKAKELNQASKSPKIISVLASIKE